jgi:F-type H+-transporting ATPase subunit epsilon
VTEVERLYLEIITPERLMVGQEVDMVEAPGAAGEFGVLPGHVAFLTTLDHGEIRFMAEGTTRFVATSGGFAEVLDNKVTMLVDTAEFEEEIDVERARRARERAEAALKALSFEAAEYHGLHAALIRAITRISTGSRVSQ